MWTWRVKCDATKRVNESGIAEVTLVDLGAKTWTFQVDPQKCPSEGQLRCSLINHKMLDGKQTCLITTYLPDHLEAMEDGRTTFWVFQEQLIREFPLESDIATCALIDRIEQGLRESSTNLRDLAAHLGHPWKSRSETLRNWAWTRCGSVMMTATLREWAWKLHTWGQEVQAIACCTMARCTFPIWERYTDPAGLIPRQKWAAIEDAHVATDSWIRRIVAVFKDKSQPSN